MFIGVLHSVFVLCFCIWDSSYLVQFFYCVQDENTHMHVRTHIHTPFHQPGCRFWGFPRCCMDTPALCFLLSLVAELWSLYVLSRSYNTACQLLAVSFVFLKVARQLKFGFSFVHRHWVCFLYQSLLSGPYTGSQQQSRGRYGFGTWYTAGAHGSVEGICGWASCCSPEAVSRNCISLIPSRNLIFHPPYLLLPPSHRPFTSMLWILWGRNECLW